MGRLFLFEKMGFSSYSFSSFSRLHRSLPVILGCCQFTFNQIPIREKEKNNSKKRKIDRFSHSSWRNRRARVYVCARLPNTSRPLEHSTICLSNCYFDFLRWLFFVFIYGAVRSFVQFILPPALSSHPSSINLRRRHWFSFLMAIINGLARSPASTRLLSRRIHHVRDEQCKQTIIMTMMPMTTKKTDRPFRLKYVFPLGRHCPRPSSQK